MGVGGQPGLCSNLQISLNYTVIPCVKTTTKTNFFVCLILTSRQSCTVAQVGLHLHSSCLSFTGCWDFFVLFCIFCIGFDYAAHICSDLTHFSHLSTRFTG